MHGTLLLPCQPQGSKVLNREHGIERIDYGTSVRFVPWYWNVESFGRFYYVRAGKRVECASWQEAYNHIARSRRLPLLNRGASATRTVEFSSEERK